MKTDDRMDFFASRAMGAILTALTRCDDCAQRAYEVAPHQYAPSQVARLSYDMADAMMCERARRSAQRASATN